MKRLFVFIPILFSAACMSAETVTVNVINNQFSPSTVTINQNDMVKWTFSEGTHTVTSGNSCTPDGHFDSGSMNQGSVFTVTMPDAGTFHYYCKFHCSMGMTGTIVVNTATGIASQEPLSYINLKSYPNPFTESTSLTYSVNRKSNVKIEVLDLTGKTVQIINQVAETGINTQKIDMAPLPKGIYITRLSSEGIESKSILLSKE